MRTRGGRTRRQPPSSTGRFVSWISTRLRSVRLKHCSRWPMVWPGFAAPADRLDESLCRAADYITPNTTEAERLTGVSVRSPADGFRAGERLLARGARAALVKLGADGCAFTSATTRVHVRATPRTAIDTTGAGDAFTGGSPSACSSSCRARRPCAIQWRRARSPSRGMVRSRRTRHVRNSNASSRVSRPHRWPRARGYLLQARISEMPPM